MSADELSRAKLTRPCHTCHKLGHWADDHNPDGSLKPGTPCFEPNVVQPNPNPAANDNARNAVGNDRNPRDPVAGFMANIVESGDSDPTPDNTVVCASTNLSTPTSIGPLVDDGAPFCAIGNVELMYHHRRLVGDSVIFGPIPEELNSCTHWQFGLGSHVSPRRRILGSVTLHLMTDSGSLITIRHLVIEGSSQWVLGRNITRTCNILHIGRHALQLPSVSNEFVSLMDHDRHSHVPIGRFLPPTTHLSSSNYIS